MSCVALTSSLWDLLGVSYPGVQVQMARGWTTHGLVSAVSNASGFGILAGARASADRLREDIRVGKAWTSEQSGISSLLGSPEVGKVCGVGSGCLRQHVEPPGSAVRNESKNSYADKNPPNGGGG